ncbi:hypothetical protein DF185_10305 [Marinifilum breve]|uniref:DinB family protein n=1 Tax=Marinifilum breve TaxID=2184082 RepID=A0A2V3ZXA7_9BACT|nr:DinB family protein [Marinifilum breve]PXY01038.1 hypothetical protein DF185_10305 [Marinifilum breve]
MQNQILLANREILSQLIHLCENITPSQYCKELSLLSQNTIGKHMRHIIEFYDILIDAYNENKPISYDNRVHCNETETSLDLASQRLRKASEWVESGYPAKELILVVSYDSEGKNSISIPSSIERELVYNIEHAIHHMAIIRIAIEKEFPDVKLHKNFGIAYSTIRYRDDLCAH